MAKLFRVINSLYYFDAAARLGSYSQAGEELCVSQAAVSQMIRKLERDLNCKLFEKRSGKMGLTDMGRLLFEHSRQGLSSLETALAHIEKANSESPMFVQASPSFAMWLMPRLWKFSLEHPTTHIHVLNQESSPSIKADISIQQSHSSNLSNDQHEVLIASEPVFPFCSPTIQNDLNIKSPIDLSKCWLVYSSPLGEDQWHRWFESAGIDKKNINIEYKWLDVSSIDLAVNAVAAGHGACLATNSSTSDLVQRGLLVKPFEIEFSCGVSHYLSYSSLSPRLNQIDEFINWIKRQLSSHVE
ncbi:LysR family transcriptional regulator [Vibrio crassostreae]|uniref:LysR family transcriptional regulator n=1 Tax=Vibrio crassostreae TaxID=246167 RepID=UPI000F49220D|nr:LysR family transcriptional regulator [Vibrio crassostreae]ROO77062.1 LysR family glycine cleavage system transcriptional activator [Vibrio crassostreae]ROR75367.1 LysR family glycine cleavage system transcriptional activator [Vibrio crassostreae]TCV32816.1 LysR family glycine cleavage system transcriptional activator [Vibrio crassostreae]